MNQNRKARSRAGRVVARIEQYTDSQLKDLAETLRIETHRRAKGGGKKPLNRAELIKAIRRQVGRGTFADTLNRFADKANKFS